MRNEFDTYVTLNLCYITDDLYNLYDIRYIIYRLNGSQTDWRFLYSFKIEFRCDKKTNNGYCNVWWAQLSLARRISVNSFRIKFRFNWATFIYNCVKCIYATRKQQLVMLRQFCCKIYYHSTCHWYSWRLHELTSTLYLKLVV